MENIQLEAQQDLDLLVVLEVVLEEKVLLLLLHLEQVEQEIHHQLVLLKEILEETQEIMTHLMEQLMVVEVEQELQEEMV